MVSANDGMGLAISPRGGSRSIAPTRLLGRPDRPRRPVRAQVPFNELRPVRLLGATLDMPVPGSANVAAVALAAACAVAVFRFGMIPVLLASSMAGIVYPLML